MPNKGERTLRSLRKAIVTNTNACLRHACVKNFPAAKAVLAHKHTRFPSPSFPSPYSILSSHRVITRSSRSGGGRTQPTGAGTARTLPWAVQALHGGPAGRVRTAAPRPPRAELRAVPRGMLGAIPRLWRAWRARGGDPTPQGEPRKEPPQRRRGAVGMQATAFAAARALARASALGASWPAASAAAIGHACCAVRAWPSWTPPPQPQR